MRGAWDGDAGDKHAFERIIEGRVEEGCQVAVLTVRKGNE